MQSKLYKNGQGYEQLKVKDQDLLYINKIK